MESLPPWEANRYFHLPVETTVNVVAGQVNQLVTADPMRVGLLLGVPAGNTQPVSFSINPITQPNQGFIISQNIGYLLLTHHDVGPLVQMPWYAIPQSGTMQATFTTLTLNDWPQDDPAATRDVADQLAHIVELIKAMGARSNGTADGALYALKKGQSVGR